VVAIEHPLSPSQGSGRNDRFLEGSFPIIPPSPAVDEDRPLTFLTDSSARAAIQEGGNLNQQISEMFGSRPICWHPRFDLRLGGCPD
jgi:hypothetical protein